LASHETIKNAARGGLADSGGSLPYLETIQGSFGSSHDLSGVRAHSGRHAADATYALNAKAYTMGDQIAFGEQPDLRLAAHEAAHVVQQRAGVSLDGGVGARGDKYEQHADAVADRVVSGQSAADLLDPLEAEGSTSSTGVQKYSVVQSGGNDARLSDDGNILLPQDSGGGGNNVWATPGRIDHAETKLDAAGSAVQLEGINNTKVVGGKTLYCVMPTLRETAVLDTDTESQEKIKEMNQKGEEDSEGNKSDWLALWTDCGRASREIMGTGGDAPKGVYMKGNQEVETDYSYNPGTWTDEVYLQGFQAFMADGKNVKHLKNAGLMEKKKVFFIFTKWEKKEPVDGAQAKQFFYELDEKGRLAFAQQVGMNEGVNPEIGEAYTMATGYDLPGFAKVGRTWNFHWAGVIMKDAGDNVTLEGYAVSASKQEINKVKAKYAKNPAVLKQKLRELRDKYAGWVNRDWVFQMYGTEKAEQTFHQEHLDSGTHGTRATTLKARK